MNRFSTNPSRLIKPPQPPDGQGLFAEGLKDSFESFDHYYNFIASEKSYANQSGERVVIQQAQFRGVALNQVYLQAARLSDVYLIQCDFKQSSWHEANFRYIEMVDCDLIGAEFMRATLSELFFQNCNGSMATFRLSKLQDVRFENCDLRDANFYATDLSHVVFQNCDLRRVDFSAAVLKEVNFSGSNIENINLSPNAIRGITIQPQQAVDLVRVLGVTVAYSKQ